MNNIVNWEQGCGLCKNPFGEDEEFVRVDIPTNEFRGDDEVLCFHKGCWLKEKHRYEEKQ